MTERPILFSGPMVRAILEGRKTQTRRIVKNMPSEVEGGYFDAYNKEDNWNWWTGDHRPALPQIVCPYGKPGDCLWIRETWLRREKHERYYYRSDHPEFEPFAHDGWKPSIHMPRCASRITLEVVSVRVERLNDCSRGDAMAEGCPFPNMADGPDPRKWYAELWEQINGPGSWGSNPWVWVVEFKVIKP